MKKIWLVFMLGMVSALLVSCSSSEKFPNTENSVEYDMEVPAEEAAFSNESTIEHNQVEAASEGQTSERMIIYNAHLSIKVEDYLQTQQKIEQILLEMNGYIVNSSVNRHSEENIRAELDVRIPQEQFTIFLDEVETLSLKVNNRNITGTDVTEEYVDLEARLKSKSVVEERLLGFMENADKTEDLLKISEDLSQIQEEIERIKGRMIYLQNHSALASVSISINEEKIIVPELNNEELNVWTKTKEQFVNSLNGLIYFFSNLFIFLIGNSPVFIILSLIIIGILFIIRRYRNKENVMESNSIDKDNKKP
ncbi:DUF4349 domain-containing protein [Chengkuizengella axinellae]|uniref:DUF4349 domain-containing protein n=1 Tax=Chengkuizengella axinellae TaxID=3064388 RepID=A0ABT9J1X6_9BACL|nr:DUF4349 domain-containing protein [Chengkuizengella sp. 2205SS18-9]MDP5275620.1 DUF4349 domain-containing protein [Chengkuizengella sp. 2205SS18-9]